MSKATEAASAWLEDLKKTGAIDDESWKVLEASLTKPEAVEYIGSSQLRQQDYNRVMNEQKVAYQGELTKIQNYERELANWRGTTEKSVSQTQAELAQARAERDRVVQIAKSYGLDEADLGASVAPYTTPPGTPAKANDGTPSFDPKAFGAEYLPREEFEKLGNMFTLLPAEINDIVAEHQELFGGKSPKGMRAIVERAVKEQRPVRDVYEEEFKVADRRAELETQTREAEIKRRVDEELVKYRTEHPEARLPRPANQRSLMFDKDTVSIPGVAPATRNSFGVEQADSVNAAVAHWNSMDHSNET